MLRSIDISGRVNFQNVNFQFLRREEPLWTNVAAMISSIVVSSFDMSRELVPKVELLATEASQHLHVHFVFGFHVIFQAFVASERGRTHRAVDLLTELFRDVFAHVSR